jgi:hypothetical protein
MTPALWLAFGGMILSILISIENGILQAEGGGTMTKEQFAQFMQDNWNLLLTNNFIPANVAALGWAVISPSIMQVYDFVTKFQQLMKLLGTHLPATPGPAKAT